MEERIKPGWLTGKVAIRQVGRLFASGKLKLLRHSGKLITCRTEDVDTAFERMAEEYGQVGSGVGDGCRE